MGDTTQQYDGENASLNLLGEQRIANTQANSHSFESHSSFFKFLSLKDAELTESQRYCAKYGNGINRSNIIGPNFTRAKISVKANSIIQVPTGAAEHDESGKPEMHSNPFSFGFLFNL